MTRPDTLTRQAMTANLAALWLPPEPSTLTEPELLRQVGEGAAELLSHLRARREQALEKLEGEL